MHKLEDIINRRSVRTFSKKALSQETFNKIESLALDCKTRKNPFGNQVDCSILSLDKDEKVGTYGIIKNPQLYIGGACVNTKEALVDIGYAFEALILSLTHEGLGTCWLGGTFKRKQAQVLMDLKPSEILPVIVPVGYAEEKRTFETMMRKLVKADNRCETKAILFHKDFDHGISQTGETHLDKAVEMVRLAPSASNKQPWRMVMSEDHTSCHFYCAFTPKYDSKIGFSIQSIDIGIAMYHFEFAINSFELKGHWVFKDPEILTPDENHQYILSYCFDTIV